MSTDPLPRVLGEFRPAPPGAPAARSRPRCERVIGALAAVGAAAGLAAWRPGGPATAPPRGGRARPTVRGDLSTLMIGIVASALGK